MAGPGRGDGQCGALACGSQQPKIPCGPQRGGMQGTHDRGLSPWWDLNPRRRERLEEEPGRTEPTKGKAVPALQPPAQHKGLEVDQDHCLRKVDEFS